MYGTIKWAPNWNQLNSIELQSFCVLRFIQVRQSNAVELLFNGEFDYYTNRTYNDILDLDLFSARLFVT